MKLYINLNLLLQKQLVRIMNEVFDLSFDDEIFDWLCNP